jgi:hypothetical protein
MFRQIAADYPQTLYLLVHSNADYLPHFHGWLIIFANITSSEPLHSAKSTQTEPTNLFNSSRHFIAFAPNQTNHHQITQT